MFAKLHIFFQLPRFLSTYRLFFADFLLRSVELQIKFVILQAVRGEICDLARTEPSLLELCRVRADYLNPDR